MDLKEIRKRATERRKELAAKRAELETFIEERSAVAGGFMKSGTGPSVDRIAYARDTLAQSVQQKKDAADEAVFDYIQALHDENTRTNNRLTVASVVIASVVGCAVLAQVWVGWLAYKQPMSQAAPIVNVAAPPAPTVVVTCASPVEKAPQTATTTGSGHVQ
jgi:hypothetical protein